MKIEIPEKIIRACIDSNIIQTHGSLSSAEARGNHTKRLTYQVGEYVVAVVGREMRNRKLMK